MTQSRRRGSSPMSGIKDDGRTEILPMNSVRTFPQRAGEGRMGADGFTRGLKALRIKV